MSCQKFKDILLCSNTVRLDHNLNQPFALGIAQEVDWNEHDRTFPT
jgi:hypothetical protein